MTLAIALLGPPEILVDGTALQVDTRKAIALLAFLAVEGGEHPRDRVVELLWPDADPERSRSSLRRTLSTLRGALGGRWVSADRSMIGLDPRDVVLDFHEFVALADDDHGHDLRATCPRCLPEMQRAAGLHRGEFLGGFALRDAAGFESWSRIRAEQAARFADGVLRRLAAAHAALGEYPRAIEVAWRRVALDPLHEEAYRSAMLLHAWAGDRGAAVEGYRRLVATLDTELGVAPLEETTELYEAILEEDLPRPPAPRPDPTTTLPRPPALPLVGRDREVETVLAALEPGAVVGVSGDLGMGATRLISEVTGRLAAAGATVLVGSGALPAIPFGVIHGALIDAITAHPDRLATLPASVLAEAGRVFPSLSRTPPPPADSGTRTRLLDALGRLIAAMPRPVLVVDDAHWTDESSAEFLGFIAARGRHFGVALLYSATPGAEAISPLIRSTLDQLADLGPVLTLTPLDLDAVNRLVAAAGTPTDGAELHRRTGGVPLLVVETLRATAEGRSASDPEQIRRIYGARLGTLGGTATQTLDAVVVLGRPAAPSLIAMVSGRSLEETDDAIDGLIRRRLVLEGDDGAVTAVHEHLAAAVAAGHTAARRRLLHRRAAAALESAQPLEPGRIARHHLAASDQARAADWLKRAGDEAAALFAHGEAIDHYEASLAAGYPDRATLHRAAANSALLAGRYPRAISGFEAALAEGGPDAVVEHRIGEVHRRLRRWELAAAHYSRALAQTDDPELRAVVAADAAFVASRQGDSSVTAMVREALRLAAVAGTPRARARAENVAGLIANGSDRVAHLRRALDHATDPGERMAVLNNLSAAVPDNAEAVQLSRDALGLALESGDQHLIAALHNSLADALHRSGDEVGSREALTAAVTGFRDIASGEADPWVPEVWLLTEW